MESKLIALHTILVTIARVKPTEASEARKDSDQRGSIRNHLSVPMSRVVESQPSEQALSKSSEGADQGGQDGQQGSGAATKRNRGGPHASCEGGRRRGWWGSGRGLAIDTRIGSLSC